MGGIWISSRHASRLLGLTSSGLEGLRVSAEDTGGCEVSGCEDLGVEGRKTKQRSVFLWRG